MAAQFNSGHLLPEHRRLFLNNPPDGWRSVAGDYGASNTDRQWLKNVLHDFRDFGVCLCPSDKGFEVFTEKPYIEGTSRGYISTVVTSVTRRLDV